MGEYIELRVIYLIFFVIHRLSSVSCEPVGSRNMECILQARVGDLLCCSSPFSCLILVCCLTTIHLHSQSLWCQTYQWRVNCNMLSSGSCGGILGRPNWMLGICLILSGLRLHLVQASHLAVCVKANFVEAPIFLVAVAFVFMFDSGYGVDLCHWSCGFLDVFIIYKKSFMDLTFI